MGQRKTLLLHLTLGLLTSAIPFVTRTSHAQPSAAEPAPASTTESAPAAAPAESPAPASPSDSSEPSSADRTIARQLAQEGYNALKAKDYSTAADRFGRALAIVNAPTLRRDLARAQVGLGQLVDAHENYNRILREGVAAGAPQPWVKALADAKAEVSNIASRLPHLNITVQGPSAPRVTIDGKPIAAASLGIKRPVDPGRHEVRALGSGYYTAKKVVTLKEGESVNIAFELEEAPPDASPTVLEEERSGKVVVTFAEPAWRKPTMIGAYAVGGAGLVLGAVTGILALRQHGKLSTDCARDVCGPKQRQDLDRYYTYGQLSTIGFVIAGVGAAGGTVLLFMRPQPQEEDKAPPASASRGKHRAAARGHWSPFIGLGSAGLDGTF